MEPAALKREAIDQIEEMLGDDGWISKIKVEPAELAAFSSSTHWQVEMEVVRSGFEGTIDFRQTWKFYVTHASKPAIDYLIDKHEEYA